MKQYIQITAGRGPVECARAVTLVARELCRQYPQLTLTDSEPHNTVADCFMSLTFAIEADDVTIIAMKTEWSGTVLYRSTANSFRPGHKRRNWFVGVNL